MRYTLWSHGRLVGYTALDIHTVSANMRQGFIEPTEEGEPLLRDATGVPRAIAEERRLRRERGGGRVDLDAFQAACDRREALNLELRDESGAAFECDFMRVWDLREMESDALNEPDEDDDDDLELSESLDVVMGESNEGNDFERSEEEADIEAALMEWKQDAEDEEMYHSAWPPPPPPDERWATMRYELQVHLKTSMDLGDEF